MFLRPSLLRLIFRKMFVCAAWSKHVIIIEDLHYSNLYMQSNLMEKWDLKESKIKVSKEFTQSEKLHWIIFNWYLTNAILNKHPSVGTWHLISTTHIKVLLRFFFLDKKSGTSKKIRKLWSCTQNGREVWKFLVLLIFLRRLSRIID